MRKYTVVFFLLISALTAVYLISGLLTVKKIVVVSKYMSVNGTEIFGNINYFSTDTAEIKRHILRRNEHIKDVRIEKVFPGELIIELVWRSPAAVLVMGDSEYYVDTEGRPAKSDAETVSDLPVIRLPSYTTNTSSPDWRIVKILDLLRELDKYDIQLSDLNISSDAALLNAKIGEETVFVWSMEKDPFEAAASLQTIISRFRIEGKIVKKIDYRFDKPVATLRNE